MIKNSIIYYSSARGFDLPSRPHFLMLRGFTGSFKGDSRCTVSSLIHQPSLSTYRQTHPCSVCLCTAKHTNTLILWLKQLAALTEMKYNIHISPSEGKTFSFSFFCALDSAFSLFFAFSAPSLGRLALSSPLQIQMQFLNFKVLNERAVLQQQQSAPKTIVCFKWM